MSTPFDDAVAALTWRLRDWNVVDAGVKARQFIDDLVKRGWQAGRPELIARRPPRQEDECRTHPGEYATHCRCCASERLAPHEDLGGRPAGLTAADARAAIKATALCHHKVHPDACAACRVAARPATEENADA